MIESTETATEEAIAAPGESLEPTDEIAEAISESTADLLSEELGDEATEFPPTRPSKTLIAAILMLAVTLGISCFAAVTLWSLSDDRQASPGHTATK